MADKAWKALERRCARALGGRRIPVTGIDRHGADVVTPMFYVQVKLRKSLPGWIWEWLTGIRMSARESGRVGVLVLKKPRQRDAEALVVLTWGDWCELHGVPKEDP